MPTEFPGLRIWAELPLRHTDTGDPVHRRNPVPSPRRPSTLNGPHEPAADADTTDELTRRLRDLLRSARDHGLLPDWQPAAGGPGRCTTTAPGPSETPN